MLMNPLKVPTTSTLTTPKIDHVTLALVGLAVAAGRIVYIPGLDRPRAVHT